MSEVEKQEGQKTVVAFITGLLIGGLLVWVFSSTPENQPADTMENDTTTEETTEMDDDTTKEAVISNVTVTESTKVTSVSGNGTLSVTDQTAGGEISLGEIKYPNESGWIVIRDYANSTGGNVLGAARYNLDEGLTPTAVSLLRKTVSGSSYQAVFYNDNGDKKFSLNEDALVTGGEAVFKAK